MKTQNKAQAKKGAGGAVRLIAVAQVKGGAGRSTLATNLAGELSKRAATVLIDADLPQATCSSWYALRGPLNKPGGLRIDTAADHRELTDKINQWAGALAAGPGFIIVDGPPRIAEISRAMVLLADLVLIPAGASLADLWATGDILAMVKDAKAINPAIQARLVWTRYRRFTNQAKTLAEQAGAELGAKALKTTMGLRVAYPEALGSGVTVAELADKQAKAELAALVAEVHGIMK